MIILSIFAAASLPMASLNFLQDNVLGAVCQSAKGEEAFYYRVGGQKGSLNRATFSHVPQRLIKVAPGKFPWSDEISFGSVFAAIVISSNNVSVRTFYSKPSSDVGLKMSYIIVQAFAGEGIEKFDMKVSSSGIAEIYHCDAVANADLDRGRPQ